MIKAPIVFFCLLLVLATHSASASDLTLESAVSEAISASPGLQKANSAAKEADAHKLGSYAAFLPTVSATGSYLLNKKYMLTDIALPGASAAISIPAIVPTTIASLDARWTLFEGFRSVFLFKGAEASKVAAHDDADWARFQVERQVVLGFYRALGAQTLREVAEQNLKTIEDHQKDVNMFRKAGISTKYDVLRVDVQVSEAKSELLNAQDMADTARGKLAETLGAETEERALSGALPEPNPDWSNAVSLADLASRKDVQALHERVRAVDFAKRSMVSHWSPRIGFFGTYQYYNNRNDNAFDSSAFRDAYQVGLNLQWTLFDGLADLSHQREAVEQAVQAEAGYRATQLHAKQDFDYWHKRYLYFCSMFRSRQSDMAKSTESVRLAKEGRRAGTLTNTELLDAELELFRARAGIVNAQIGAVEALVNLELATGRELHKFQ